MIIYREPRPFAHHNASQWLLALFCVVMAAAPLSAAGEDLKPAPGEIQLVGTVRTINLHDNTFTLSAASVTLPGGAFTRFNTPRQKTVQIAQETLLHLRTNPARTIILADLKEGVLLIVTGRDQGAGQPLVARDIVASLAEERSKPKDRDLVVVPASGTLAGKQIYTDSYALLVGVNDYLHLPREQWLDYAVNDVNDLKEVLTASYGFPSEHITTLTIHDATLNNIQQALAKLADRRKIKPNDRILLYFSGHGQTIKMPGGGEMGFLVPYDADVDLNDLENPGPFLGSCLRMDTVWGYLESSPAKHSLVIADACYSGLLVKQRSMQPISEAALTSLAARRATQVITAGRQGEPTIEDPRFGHGDFTYELIDELKARAAVPGQVFTAAELYTSLQRSVGNVTGGKRTPQMGNDNTEGEFFFITAGGHLAPDNHSGDREGRIAFQRFQDGHSSICTMNIDGTDQVQITTGADAQYADWSPDGRRILYTRSVHGRWQVFVMNANGLDQSQLTTDADSGEAGWSRDGSRITFESNRDGKKRIFVMNVDGSAQQPLTAGPKDYEPSWSPDGKRIVFTGIREGHWHIFVMDADGSHERQLTNSPSEDGVAKWSPDGKRIAFSRLQGGMRRILVMKPDGTGAAPLTRENLPQQNFSWSPDGSRVVFHGGQNQNSKIFIINSDGSNLRQLDHSQFDDGLPAWQPSPGSNGSAPPPVPIDGLVGWWPGNGITLDLAGGDDGRMVGAVTYAPALTGQGFLIYGKDGGVVIPDADPLKVTGSLTLGAWSVLPL